ncbi:MAG: HAD superfamily hydrolase (TIGR01490 family) [Paraglaciecola psychrophila]
MPANDSGNAERDFMALAIFDLDNTLLNGDSDHAWGEFLVAQGLVDAEHYQQANEAFYQQYQQGSLDIFEFLAFSLKPLADNSRADLDRWHLQFMAQVIAPMRQHKAEQLLAKHRAQGDYLLIITATNAFVTAPIAQSLGVDHLLATEPELRNGVYTGAVSGIPCFQQGKVERLDSWLADSGHNLVGSYFYSDSINDLPLLEQVEHPVVVDADPLLRAQAQARGWTQLSLRD